MGAFKDLSGLRFGRLLVIGISHRDQWEHIFWLCQCDCGAKSSIMYSSLTRGLTRSCGCLRRETSIRRFTTHGQAGWRNGRRTPEYDAWQNMIRRCYDPNNQRYEHYGARGITVCARWRHSFENFLADMGQRPPGKTKNGRALYSIDRINNDSGYNKKNCRWTTTSEQNRKH